MKYIMKHFGEAVLVAVCLLALGGIVVALCTGDGYVAKQFQDALSSFFTNMNGLLNTGGAGETIILP